MAAPAYGVLAHQTRLPGVAAVEPCQELETVWALTPNVAAEWLTWICPQHQALDGRRDDAEPRAASCRLHLAPHAAVCWPRAHGCPRHFLQLVAQPMWWLLLHFVVVLQRRLQLGNLPGGARGFLPCKQQRIFHWGSVTSSPSLKYMTIAAGTEHG